MKLSVENKIRMGFGAALVFLVLTGAAAFWSAIRSNQTFRSVEHNERVLAQLTSAFAAILDVETGARGFALAGGEEFLEPFNSGQVRAIAALNELRGLTANNPEQQRN